MKYFILIVSFLLEGVLSKYFPVNYFSSLFGLTALIVSYPYFTSKNVYFKHAFVYGFLYDLFYTDTLVFYAFVYLFMAFVISKIYLVLPINFLNLIFAICICIFVFRSITYLCFVITGNLSFDFFAYMKSVRDSLIVNLIYGILIYFLTNFISKKMKIRKTYKFV